jgi:hypothetical protein
MNETLFIGKCLYMNPFAKLQTLRHRLAAKTSSCSVTLFVVNWNSQVYNRPLIFHLLFFWRSVWSDPSQSPGLGDSSNLSIRFSFLSLS